MKQDDRAHNRRPILWSGTLTHGDHAMDCQLWNLSPGGARVRAGAPLPNGAKIALFIPKIGELKAVIAWQEDNELGVKFTTPEKDIIAMMGETAAALGFVDEDKDEDEDSVP